VLGNDQLTHYVRAPIRSLPGWQPDRVRGRHLTSV